MAVLDDLKNMSDYIVLIIEDPTEQTGTAILVLQKLINEENLPGVYVTVNKPYSILKKQFLEKNINLNRVLFIDAITKTVDDRVVDTEECLYIGSPKDLTDLSIALDSATQAITAEKKFLFFDSLSTLLIYNKVESVEKFIHFLTTKMRLGKVSTVLLSLQRDKDKDLIKDIALFCDTIIDQKAMSKGDSSGN